MTRRIVEWLIERDRLTQETMATSVVLNCRIEHRFDPTDGWLYLYIRPNNPLTELHWRSNSVQAHDVSEAGIDADGPFVRVRAAVKDAPAGTLMKVVDEPT